MFKTIILLPFIFSFLLGISIFFKNQNYIRRIAKALFLLEFSFVGAALIFLHEASFCLFNINFVLDKMSLYFLFLANLIFFLFSIISKSFIIKMHRVFYSINFLLLGLVGLALCCDNIFIFLISLFWTILINYFLTVSFSSKEAKKDANVQLGCDLAGMFICVSLILKQFARYFVVNDIDFAFSNLTQNLYKIDDFAILPAFFALLILVSRLFNFVPFCAKNISLYSKANPFVFSLNVIISYILGCYLFLKCYLNFDYLFYQYQDEIALYLLINLAIYSLLVLRCKKLFKFLSAVFVVNILISVFSVFSFQDECVCNFIYYSIALSLAYCMCAFVFSILKNKFKTDDTEEFGKISSQEKATSFLVAASLFNIAPAPFFVLFSAQFFSFIMIFATDYESALLNISPYCLILGALLVLLSVFEMFNRIMIQPSAKQEVKISFCNHQIVCLFVLLLIIIMLAFFAQGIFEIFIEFGKY